jgi:hypothetical protein
MRYIMEETVFKELLSQGPLGILCIILLYAFYRFARYHVEREKEHDQDRKDTQTTLFEVIKNNTVMLDRITTYLRRGKNDDNNERKN